MVQILREETRIQVEEEVAILDRKDQAEKVQVFRKVSDGGQPKPT